MDGYIRTAFQELFNDDGLCVMAPGLGIQTLFLKFIRGFSDKSENGLVFCLNATDEVQWITEGLRSEGISPDNFPKIVLSDTLGQDRSLLYQQGGCIIVTSRILINDLLKGIVAPTQVSGMLVYNAHKTTETCTESFILRVFKQGNPNGFVKGFSDDAQNLSQGFSHMERVMQQLYVRKLYLYPRFHEAVQKALLTGDGRKDPEVVELRQPMTSAMTAVQKCIIAVMQTCLQELKKAAPQLDASTLTLENGIFYSFDKAIRSQLDPEWHRLSFRTKQLVMDLTTIRQLLDYLVRYDAVTFYSFLLSVKAAGTSQHTPSLWLTSSIADTLFRCSRERVLAVESVKKDDPSCRLSLQMGLDKQLTPILEIPPKWLLLQDVLKEIRDEYATQLLQSTDRQTHRCTSSGKSSDGNEKANSQSSMSSVLSNMSRSRVVIIVRETKSLCQIKDFLACPAYSNSPPAPPEAVSSSRESRDSVDKRVREGMLHIGLRQFVTQQATHIRQMQSGGRGFPPKGANNGRGGRGGGRGGERGPSARGKGSGMQQATLVIEGTVEVSEEAAPLSSSGSSLNDKDFEGLRLDQKMLLVLEKNLQTDKIGMRVLGLADDTPPPSELTEDRKSKPNSRKKRSADVGDIASSEEPSTRKRSRKNEDGGARSRSEFYDKDGEDEEEEDTATLVDEQFHIYILTHEMCREYLNPFDDIQPSRVIFLDADIRTIRQVETYHANTLREDMKIYFLMYGESIEEHRYIASLKREKQAFDSLINKKAHMAIELPDTVQAIQHAQANSILPSDSRHKARDKPKPIVVVDMREFGSSLPSLLHLNGFVLQPVTLLVGDYILAPQICIERKGISDMFQSFASGRLYAQAESMSRHYDLPALLLEFSPNRSFSLQAENEIPSEIQIGNVCSKIALLVIAFPNLRILWSRSPHVTIDIYRSLKTNFEEPNVDTAVAMGGDGLNEEGLGTAGEDDTGSAQDMQATACDILMSLPGINSTNVRAVINNVEDLAHLSRMSVAELTPFVGPINAKKLVGFFVSQE